MGASPDTTLPKAAVADSAPTANGDYAIEVHDLNKYYGDRHALRGLSFSVKRGEILGFLGPNGAGKTTTMRILTGYMPPSSGMARVAGYDVFKQSIDVRQHIGYLPETVPLYLDMTVYDYLDYTARLHHVHDVDDAVEYSMELGKPQRPRRQFDRQAQQGLSPTRRHRASDCSRTGCRDP